MNDTTTILCTNGGTQHTHNSVLESKVCYGLLPSSALTPTTSVVSRPSALMAPEPSWHMRPVSEKQLWKLEKIGGKACATAAKYLNRGQASALIDELLHPEKAATVTTTPTPEPTPAPVLPTTPPVRKVDPRHEMIKGLLPMVRDGYYAVHEYEGGHVDFLRISRPKKNKYHGAIKVQTVHGSYGAPRLSAEPVAALWPSGTFSVYERSGRVEDMLLLLVADPQGALRRYARLIGHCCRCNATLTDDKSRHYGIGPECVKHWPEIIETVDMEDAIAKAEAEL